VEEESSHSRRIVLPADPICITPDHILGLVESVYSTGGRLDSEELNDLIDVDLDVLTHAIDVSEAMGLMRFEKGDLVLTEKGAMVAEAIPKKAHSIIKNYVKNIEPLDTIMRKASRHGNEISIEELRNILSSYYGGPPSTRVENCIREWIRFLGIRVV